MNIHDRVAEVLELARAKYGFAEPVTVRMDLRGLVRGQAIGKRKGDRIAYTLRFNLDAFALDEADSIQNNVPHEIAHLVVMSRYYANPSRIRPGAHGWEWKSVCLGLGGNGSPRHGLNTSRVRAKTVHTYTLPRAGAVSVGPKQHKAIQSGARYRVAKTRELIAADCYTGESRVVVKAHDR